ncbi:MAG: dicarboxylate/amino acid:cation symporter [Bacteroidales bacterium]|nr:dicarboxylate/amino acid:cation symporter [Bacteroidales bacterium]
MSEFWRNYRSTAFLLLGIIAGGVAGVIAGPSASIVKPVGDIFLNLIFVLVVPLVFFSIAQGMCSLKKGNLIGKVLGSTVGIFAVMSIIAGILAYVMLLLWNPFEGVEAAGVSSELSMMSDASVGEVIVRTFTVPDFTMLLSKSNLLPLIVFSAILGLAVAALGEKASTVQHFLDEGVAVIMKMMEIVMYLAPVGLGCYFADMIGNIGSAIVGSYLEVFIEYWIMALVVYVLIHSVYIISCRGNLVRYWKNMITPSLTAVGTCSSAACIPVNIAAAKRMGVNISVAESVIPIGINIHKDGSVMTAVVKIVFAMVFFSKFSPSPGNAALVILMSILVSVVTGAVPIGGMTGEILICSILGVDPSFAATLLLIGTITDMPATLVNSTANVVGAYMVSSITDDKDVPR